MSIVFAGKTDIGKKRDNNQDYYSVKELNNGNVLCTVCDGMGGANGGSTASTLAQETFDGYIEQNINSYQGLNILELMYKALEKANLAVFNKSKKDSELFGMGTTLVSCLCDGEKYYCITVGDSRIYSICEDQVKQISHDHSFVQSLIDCGAITEIEAKVHPNRNIITRAVGTNDKIQGDVFCVECDSVKGLLLCSDGLCGYIDHDDLEDICIKNADPELCVNKLVEKANLESGADNITAVVVKKL